MVVGEDYSEQQSETAMRTVEWLAHAAARIIVALL